MKRGLLVMTMLGVLALSACGPGMPATPTIDVNALYTAAAVTFAAELTQAAAATTPTPEFTVTLSVTDTPTLTPGPTSTPTKIICDNAIWVADVSIPDNAEMAAGQEFIKTWRVRNTGSCTWKSGYTLGYAYGEKMSGQATAVAGEVPPDGEVEISITLKAPTTAGPHYSYWRLYNNNGVPFGQVLTLIIVVK